MPADDSLKRLGGGRWVTRDGRFAIEPQSGTWVIVDNAQTDDLGLPLVRGPFGSLTAAKEAIESARSTGPAESPLADRVKQARAHGQDAKPSKTSASSDEAKADKPSQSAEPEPPPEPKWLRDLDPSDRRRARELIERLEQLDVVEPKEIARSEIARNLPAVTRLAIERAIRRAIATSTSPAGGARATVEVILGGRDTELGARWRLVDDQGRKVDEIDVPE